jgi:hypothetical protein
LPAALRAKLFIHCSYLTKKNTISNDDQKALLEQTTPDFE